MELFFYFLRAILTFFRAFDGNSHDSTIIITQLALALADLYLQVPEWNNFISEILNRLVKVVLFLILFRLTQNLNVMLVLLKVLPEELQNRYLKLGENRRTAVESELAAQSESVYNVLVSRIF